MKKFFDGGEYFVLTSYRIKTVPIAEDNEVGLTLAKTICEDACYLSSAGNGQTAIEILRIAGRKAGSRIHHLLTLRTHDSSEHDCVVRQEALEKGILSLLHQSGFTAEEVSFEKYRKHISEMDTDSVWALMKQDIQEYGVQETYKSPSVVESVDWKRIYSVLDGSGCGLCIYDTVKALRCDVVTVACGMAASMGAFLLAAAGTKGKRWCQPNAEVLIHQPLGGTSGQATDIRIHAEHILKTRAKLNKIFSDCTGQSSEKIEADTERDNIMSAEEALKYGLVDKVGDPISEW